MPKRKISEGPYSPQAIGERIARAREAVRINQTELARRCGFDLNTERPQTRVSNYERGQREPTADDMVKIAHALGVQPALLAYGDDGLTTDERLLLTAYRRGDESGRGFLLATANQVLSKLEPATADKHPRRRSTDVTNKNASGGGG